MIFPIATTTNHVIREATDHLSATCRKCGNRQVIGINTTLAEIREELHAHETTCRASQAA